MNKSKLTLIVDGNWLLMSRLAVICNKYNDDDLMLKDLKILMIKSINIVLKTFPKIDNIIFVADGGSWRNQIDDIPKFLLDEHIQYKGNRENQMHVDLDKVFYEYENFLNVLKENNINVSRSKGIEGDDWCYWWSTYLNSKNTNVIIWSKDRDLYQLVNTNNNGCFTICWNKENGLTTKNIEDNGKDDINYLMHMFSEDYSANSELYDYVCNKNKQINKINPNEVVLDKIIRGDSGDNILPILLRNTKNSSRTYKISPKDIDYTIDVFNEKSIKNYIHNICSKKQYQNRVGNKSEEDIYSHFIYNRKLVLLDKINYPSTVIEEFNKNTEYICNTDLNPVINKINAINNDIDNILEEI